MFQLYSGMEFQLKLQVYACKRRLKLTENRLLLELFEDDNLYTYTSTTMNWFLTNNCSKHEHADQITSDREHESRNRTNRYNSLQFYMTQS